jgi:hypothetical protein
MKNILWGLLFTLFCAGVGYAEDVPTSAQLVERHIAECAKRNTIRLVGTETNYRNYPLPKEGMDAVIRKKADELKKQFPQKPEAETIRDAKILAECQYTSSTIVNTTAAVKSGKEWKIARTFLQSWRTSFDNITKAHTLPNNSVSLRGQCYGMWYITSRSGGIPDDGRLTPCSEAGVFSLFNLGVMSPLRDMEELSPSVLEHLGKTPPITVLPDGRYAVSVGCQTYTFNSRVGYLLESVTTHFDKLPEKEIIFEQEQYEDYRDVNGCWFPFKSRVERYALGGDRTEPILVERQSYEIQSAEMNVDIKSTELDQALPSGFSLNSSGAFPAWMQRLGIVGGNLGKGTTFHSLEWRYSFLNTRALCELLGLGLALVVLIVFFVYKGKAKQEDD